MKIWEKIQHFCTSLSKKDSIEDLDVMLISNDFMRHYLLEKSTDPALFFVNKDSSIDIITNSMLVKSFKESETVRIHVASKALADVVSELASKRGWKKIGYEYQSIKLSFKDHVFRKIPKNVLVPINETNLRRIKTTRELKLMKEAANISVEILEQAKVFIKKEGTRLTEIDVSRFISKKMFEKDCVEGFPTIVACGKNGIHPHAKPGNRKLKEKSLITIDFGAKYKGYCSDMTRTLSIGEPGEKNKFIYETVLEAHDKAVEQLKSGISFFSLQKIVVDFFESKKVKDKYTHGLGHGVGLEVHEAPFLGNKLISPILKVNDVITIEPGLYNIHGTGCRFENEFIVKKNGFELLTNASRELVI